MHSCVRSTGTPTHPDKADQFALPRQNQLAYVFVRILTALWLCIFLKFSDQSAETSDSRSAAGDDGVDRKRNNGSSYSCSIDNSRKRIAILLKSLHGVRERGKRTAGTAHKR